jgi:hypothetical protein
MRCSVATFSITENKARIGATLERCFLIMTDYSYRDIGRRGKHE